MVCCPVPPTVVIVAITNRLPSTLFVKLKVPLPPVVFFTILRVPVDEGGVSITVLLNVHVVVWPSVTLNCEGVPFVQLLLVRVAVAGTYSVTEYNPAGGATVDALGILI